MPAYYVRISYVLENGIYINCPHVCSIIVFSIIYLINRFDLVAIEMTSTLWVVRSINIVNVVITSFVDQTK